MPANPSFGGHRWSPEEVRNVELFILDACKLPNVRRCIVAAVRELWTGASGRMVKFVMRRLLAKRELRVDKSAGHFRITQQGARRLVPRMPDAGLTS